MPLDDERDVNTGLLRSELEARMYRMQKRYGNNSLQFIHCARAVNGAIYPSEQKRSVTHAETTRAEPPVVVKKKSKSSKSQASLFD